MSTEGAKAQFWRPSGSQSKTKECVDRLKTLLNEAWKEKVELLVNVRLTNQLKCPSLHSALTCDLLPALVDNL